VDRSVELDAGRGEIGEGPLGFEDEVGARDDDLADENILPAPFENGGDLPEIGT
jgi:hypothetical protein